MKATVGLFTALAGKNGRIYIKWATDARAQDPLPVYVDNDQLLFNSIDKAKDLAASIVALERKMIEKDSVESRAGQATN